MIELLQLSSEALRVQIDPDRGSDILSLVDLRTGVDLLFSTPWRARADSIRAGDQLPTSSDSQVSWMEQYRGGWQTLCPNAGPPRDYLGATLGFHGEASCVPWSVVQEDDSHAALTVDLFTVPVRIERRITVEGPTFGLVDVITNLSDIDLVIDYSNHPAFGGDFLAAECHVRSNATSFVPDPAEGELPSAWPDPRLAVLSAPGRISNRFGWLTGFPGQGDDGAWASVTNPVIGLTARISWDPVVLPHAWWWQEFNSSRGFPWFGKARVFALEPASTQTGGPGRASVMAIAAGASVRVPVRLTVEEVVEGESDRA